MAISRVPRGLLQLYVCFVSLGYHKTVPGHNITCKRNTQTLRGNNGVFVFLARTTHGYLVTHLGSAYLRILYVLYIPYIH